MQEQRKRPAFLQRVKKRFAGTEEVSSVPTKSEKEVCKHRGEVASVPAKSKKRFAGTEEEASVPAKSEKEVCRNRGSVHRSYKE
ncbi:hypothetical protein QA612_03065 [Evansella sp. AB-P1]|uniref:hypothetical protein n=1 Tax=Evansella sp. AB-P1 TaxID=3037653 RepID=UPI00241EA2BD|nr:hypothetical protein [Evansella sp. AB-P1]MDG5786456.1 hypothetical protein [Evansella sp. AB-P1]